MCEGQTFRGFVNERLAAVAGEMRALFQRTTAECEEELRRSQDENKRNLRLLDKLLSPRVVLVRVDTGPSLKQEITETSRIKEEQEERSVTREEEQLPVCFPESSAVCVKREEPSPLQQRQTEQVQSRDSSTKVSTQNESAPETSATVNNEETSGADGGAERKKRQCHVCDKKFGIKQDLTRHIRVHTGERPYCCPVCEKKFTQLSNLKTHRRTHTHEKTHSCSICNKTFSRKSTLDAHRRTHTGERPYGCSVCQQTFTQRFGLQRHMKTHSV